MARVSAATPRVLCRYPDAPACRACRIPSVSGSALSTSTLVRLLAASNALMARIPLSSAKCRSIRHTSGWVRRTVSMVSGTLRATVTW